MSRKLVLLAVLAFTLAVFSAGALAGDMPKPYWAASVDIAPAGKTRVVHVRYSFTGDSKVKEIRLTLVGFRWAKWPKKASPYLKLLPGSTKSLQLANGTKYWVVRNPPLRFQQKPAVTLVVQVRADIPLHVRQCVSADIKMVPVKPALVDDRPGAGSFCVSGEQWLKPLIP